ncbi:MAG: MacB family efflux pump subunit [Alphaproteobacteria bacterium]|nr:MacB family efflux pump subunit [Alphaproteobacteria bacterium]
MDAALDMPAAAANASSLIELSGVSRTYVTGADIAVEALKRVSLRIDAGEFVAIMGASGSGKSTLMHLIGCLDRPSGGHYRFAGQDLAVLDRDDRARLRREAFGFVFQSYHLIPTATALENVEIPAMYAGLAPEARRRRAAELLETLGLADRMFHRPSQLSGGQQQRVAIARALMNGGRVILADEPTGALDSQSGAELMALLRKLAARGHTIILITHDRDVANNAERVIELRDGAIVSDSGKPVDSRAVPAAAPGLPESERQRTRLAALAEGVEAAKTALRALRVNLFRTVLTLLGIVIGVASVITMLSIGEGAKQAVITRIGSMGTNLLMVRARSYNRRLAPGASAAVLMPEDADALAQLPNVMTAMPENRGNVTIRAGNIDDQTRIYGTTPDLPATRNWTVRIGTFFDWEDLRSYAPVAVLGQNVADTLFPRVDNPVGRYMLVDNIPFQVVGVLASKGSVSGDEDDDDVVFIPLTTGGLRLFGRRDVRMITVAVEDIGAMDATEKAIGDLLKARHSGGQQFRIYNMKSWLETASEAQNTLTLLLGSIAAISLLVGGIGVMNIMLVTVTERTREIGIRMATGARTRDILQQFLIEAMVVSGLGGIAGVGLGIGAGIAVRSFDMPTVFSVSTVGLAFGCAAAAGLVFGFIPAWRASRLDPVAALASE